MALSRLVSNIRKNWAIADAKRDEGLTTPEDIRRYDDISYGPYGTENLMDIYVQKQVQGLQPTIINIHGGGWVYGCKEVYQYYCMSLAQRGFTVVNINYRLAPESRFPAAVEDINAVMTFLEQHGEEYHADKDRLVLIGDSAGGQLVSHYATILTNPEFAGLFEFKLPAVKVKAVGLNCGAYDGKEMVRSGRDQVFLEYLGYPKAPKKVPQELVNKLDALGYMTAAFPAAYIMSAENDFLKNAVEPMRKHLEALGVPCRAKIYGTSEQKDVAHVFEVNIKLEEATLCNDEECAFFREYV